MSFKHRFTDQAYAHKGDSRALIVEDNSDHAELVRSLLTGRGWTCHISTDLHSAFEKMKRVRYRLVLADYGLPDGPGLDLIDWVDTDATLLLVMTARGDERVAVEALQRGAYGYIPKDPIFADLLPDRIQQALERHEKDRELRSHRDRLMEENRRLTQVNQGLRTLDAIKSELMSSASDELARPLDVVGELLGMVRDGLAGPLSQEQINCLDSATANCTRLRGALELHRMRLGRLRLHRAVCNAREILEPAAKRLEGRLKKHDQKVAIEQTDGIDSIFCDQQRLRQIVYNLLDRVIDSVPGGETIRLAARSCRSDIELHIMPDSGLFEDSQALDASEPGAEPGGPVAVSDDLSVAQRIIELHGGYLHRMKDREGRLGFRLTIPRLDGKESLVATLRDRLSQAGRSDEPITLALLDLSSQAGDAAAQQRLHDDLPETTQGLFRSNDDDILYFPEERRLAVISAIDKDRAGSLLARLLEALAHLIDLNTPIEVSVTGVTPSIEAEDWLEIALRHRRPVWPRDLIDGRFEAEDAALEACRR
jgi:CheY-like chemotaxis protein